jgi:hypothetical protein
VRPPRPGREPSIRKGSPSDQIIWSSSRPWWQRYDIERAEYLSWEADAHRVAEWAVLRIPDLLYTPDYTRALLMSDRVFCAQHMVGGRLDNAGARRIADEIESRERRQDRLYGRADHPLEYMAVVEESALRRVVGGHEVMRGQLIALLDYAGSQTVTVRVAPETACAQTGIDGGYSLLDFSDPLHSPIMFAHYPGGVVIEHERHAIDQARGRFEAVLAVALPECHSIEFIEQCATILYSA